MKHLALRALQPLGVLCLLADALTVANVSSDKDPAEVLSLASVTENQTSDRPRIKIRPVRAPHEDPQALTCSEEKHRRQHDAVIVMLIPNPIQGFKDWQDAIMALKSLSLVQDKWRAEVRVFYDDAQAKFFTRDRLEYLFKAAAPRKVCAKGIQFAKFPPWISSDSWSPWEQGSKWGYMHMIRFFFVDLLDPKLGHLDGFKYWARLDTDAHFKAPVPDLFAEFDHQQDLGYIHNVENADCGRIVHGMQLFGRQYAAKVHVPIDQIPALASTKHKRCVLGWYNNFEVGRIAAFQTPQALQFTRAVVDNKGIYMSRWGDAMLRRVEIEMMHIPHKLANQETLKGYFHPGTTTQQEISADVKVDVSLARQSQPSVPQEPVDLKTWVADSPGPNAVVQHQYH